jgi:hypothetical protein
MNKIIRILHKKMKIILMNKKRIQIKAKVKKFQKF